MAGAKVPVGTGRCWCCVFLRIVGDPKATSMFACMCLLGRNTPLLRLYKHLVVRMPAFRFSSEVNQQGPLASIARPVHSATSTQMKSHLTFSCLRNRWVVGISIPCPFLGLLLLSKMPALSCFWNVRTLSAYKNQSIILQSACFSLLAPTVLSHTMT